MKQEPMTPNEYTHEYSQIPVINPDDYPMAPAPTPTPTSADIVLHRRNAQAPEISKSLPVSPPKKRPWYSSQTNSLRPGIDDGGGYTKRPSI